ncbi:hypothetical protein COCCADRAFT_10529 [Bipolaris zeicola 26-R-13]|uniref:Uncharacterized protein n=1 Tax=Cochliobolus carbonum (strain 26-R-13) TaxID=930089 RepID=W6XN45_COCC2|nr:uncharacterized protein COCCADRAFT_10529 [Bipolaris zeicola 26-R-13]EUC26670.1 hypothetical protein COCCADRAFT_10529 [Bipolaris zeicola 26-R-13]
MKYVVAIIGLMSLGINAIPLQGDADHAMELAERGEMYAKRHQYSPSDSENTKEKRHQYGPSDRSKLKVEARTSRDVWA